MSIKIETEKVVKGDGTQGYLVRSISALPEKDLPKLYLDGVPNCYLCVEGTQSLRIQAEINPGEGCTVTRLYVKDTYSEKYFHSRLDATRKSGDRLREVNDLLREKRKVWNGCETFII